MATLKKPFGRQIASMKDEARKQVGEGAAPDKLAEAGNKIAKTLGYDYTFIAESFAGKKKGKKRGGRRKKKAWDFPEAPSHVVPSKNGDMIALTDLEAVKALTQRIGAENVKRLIDVVG